MPIASTTGTANRNIIVVPCMVKIWLYRSGFEERVVGPRQLDAHQRRRGCPPSVKKPKAVTMKRRPIAL